MLVYSSNEITFIDMRIKLSFWLLLALVPFNVFGKQKLRTETDTINALISITRIEKLKGQKLSAVKRILDTYGIPIRYFSLDCTSPFVDPKGQGYINNVLLSYLTLSEMNSRVCTNKQAGIVLDITLEEPYNVNIEEFIKKHNLDVSDKKFPPDAKFDVVKDLFTIKKIECWVMGTLIK